MKYLRPEPLVIANFFYGGVPEPKVYLQKPMIAILDEMGVETHNNVVKTIGEMKQDISDIEQVIINCFPEDGEVQIGYQKQGEEE